ncbi:metallophosphoesterase family protein [Nocardia crassostreae]|uniref:metallophosphoesterase family protein n=1 Tax=Nocardia crassostreae TaxID=53428 RepID=UPI0008371D9E|nr:metallophosphoesterase [Nocardia crassostreae]
MNDWAPVTPRRLAFAGDWHANPWHSVRAVEWAAEQQVEVILHVGDYGYDFNPGFMARVQYALEQAGLVLGFVPGNHEDYNYLDRREQTYGCTAIALRPNIYYLPRGYRWTWSGVRFLAMGGAHSVDRPWREPGKSWWARELITAPEAELAVGGGPADVMLCHDVPAGVPIPAIDGNPHGFPEAEIRAAHQHQELLRAIVDEVRPRHLYAGHYHTRHSAVLDGVGYRTAVTILDDDSSPLSDNLVVVDLRELARAS